MGKEKKIIGYFIGWLVIFIFVCFVGISNVFAEEIAYSNSTFRVRECGSEEWTSWTSASQKLAVESVDRVGVRFYFNNTQLNANTYYNISLNYNYYTEAPSLNVLKEYTKTTFYYNTIASETGEISGNINNYSVRFEKDSENPNIIKAVYNVLIPANSKFISFNIRWSTPNASTCRTLAEGFTISDIKIESLNDTNAIIDSNNQNTDNIINNDNQNTQAIIDSNKETQEVIKDQFNNCKNYNYVLSSSNDLFNSNIGFLNETGAITGYSSWRYTDYITINNNKSYNITLNYEGNGSTYCLYNKDKSLINCYLYNNERNINISNNNAYYIRFSYYANSNYPNNKTEFTGEYCTNKIDEQVETSKGIWASIKDLPNVIAEKLKSLFIPDNGYFEEWFNDLKQFFELKLGFLATPFTIIIDFVNRYLQLNSNEDIIINIPDIRVPNFEDHIIVHATTFNWSELLNSKDSFKILWELYLSFIDVFLILNFIGLCETKYNRIFGGDTTPYEYYTTEDSYMFDTDTGEITKMGVHKEKKTTRKKVV